MLIRTLGKIAVYKPGPGYGSRIALCCGLGLVLSTAMPGGAGGGPAGFGNSVYAQSADQAETGDAEAGDEAPLQIPMRIARRASPLGHYLAARHAEIISENSMAADLLAVTSSRFPSAVGLQDARLSLLASEGRVDEARILADKILRTRKDQPNAKRIKFYSHVKAGRWVKAEALLKGQKPEEIDQVLIPLSLSWAAVHRNKIKEAIRTAEAVSRFQGLDALINLQKALAYDVYGDAVNAEKFYGETLKKIAAPTLRLTGLTGNFYERRGKKERARQLYTAFLEKRPNEVLVKNALARLETGKIPGALIRNERQGLAEIMYHLAGVLFSERSDITSSSLGNTALYLDPDNHFYRLQSGQMLEDQKRWKDALKQFNAVPVESDLYVRAQLLSADVLMDQKRWGRAKAVLGKIAEIEGFELVSLSKQADLYRYKEDFTQAAKAYDHLLAQADDDVSFDWPTLYYAGIAHEQSKNWPRAEALFQQALEKAPDQPLVLNYLAYSWVDQGLNLDKSLVMLKKAVESRPEDGYIVDSLGWVFYKLGDFKQAVPHLERAVALRPGDPIINDHLGDAYFRVGRKKEAVFQWRLSLSFKPKEEQKQALLDKIENGLPAFEAVKSNGTLVEGTPEGKSI